MESPGKLLKASRESQNLSLKEVSEENKDKGTPPQGYRRRPIRNSQVSCLFKRIPKDLCKIPRPQPGRYRPWLSKVSRKYDSFEGTRIKTPANCFKEETCSLALCHIHFYNCSIHWDIPESHIPVSSFPWEEGIIAHTSASDSTFSASSERGVKHEQSRCKRI